MRQTTVRITSETRGVLRSLARTEGRSMQAVLRSALEEYRRSRFVDAVDAGYAALRKDPAAWAAELAERELWEGASLDGVEENPVPYRRSRSRRARASKKR